MAGVFPRRTRRYKKSAMRDIEAIELEAAKEILAEVFRIDLKEVEDMISSRLQEVQAEVSSEGNGLWPQEFWMES